MLAFRFCERVHQQLPYGGDARRRPRDAVTGEPDPDLGERIVAWIVTREGKEASQDELAGHVADLLTPHKRPRVVHFLDQLPRNEMGKVQKKKLTA